MDNREVFEQEERELNSTNWYAADDALRARLAKHRAFIPSEPEELYPTVQKWAVNATADFIVVRPALEGGEEFLLVRRAEAPWQGQYFVPGGRIRPLEHPTEACIRNVKRELRFQPTGQQVKFSGFVPVLNPESQKSGPPWFSLWNLHRVDVSRDTEIIPNELDAKGFHWFKVVHSNFLREVKQGLALIGNFPASGDLVL